MEKLFRAKENSEEGVGKYPIVEKRSGRKIFLKKISSDELVAENVF